MPFYIEEGEPAAPALRRIAREEIGIVLSAFDDDAVSVEERVHGLRKLCKKMRALLRLIRPLMGDAFDAEDQEYRAAGKQLGEYRDGQVLARTIESLGWPDAGAYASPIEIPQAALAGSRKILLARRQAVDDWRFDIRGFEDLAPGLARTYQNCLNAWDATRHNPHDANYHLLRKRTKYHWYQVCILEHLNEQEVRKRHLVLDDLQTTLGNAHDLAVLQALLESQDDIEIELLQKAITRKRELYSHATRLGAELFATPADELVSDFARWWDMTIDSRTGHTNGQ